MNQRITESEVSLLREQSPVEDYLKTLWERVRTAGDMIRELRGEREGLHSRNSELEREVLSLRTELQQKESELKRLRAERAHLLSGGSNAGFTEEEREALRGRIHELISKINSHL